MKHTSRRLVVVSDLHLGGIAPQMMSRPELLAQFLDAVVVGHEDAAKTELVIAGDFVDFLALAPHASFTPDANAAAAKLQATMRAPEWRGVFEALARVANTANALTVLVGNHDLEIGLPPVQAAFIEELGTGRAVRFVDDGRAYRVGSVAIEHGNRYDAANHNDWDGLRAIRSAQSRFEEPKALQVSAGSELVVKLINPLKAKYPFIDLLQPQGELVALLAIALEPGLIFDLPLLAGLLNARRLSESRTDGKAPAALRNVSGFREPPRNPRLLAAFGDVYRTLQAPPAEQVSGSVQTILNLAVHRDSLWEIVRRGDPVPPARLEQIRVVLSELLLSDISDLWAGPTQQYGLAAERIIRASQGDIELVIMGHTHLPRVEGPARRPTYINTGTWADVIRVPAAAMEAGGESVLEGFLRGLLLDNRELEAPTFAEVTLDEKQRVANAALRSFPSP